MNHTISILFVSATLLATSCTRNNNLLFGEVNAMAGSHPITVTDCYLTRVPPVQLFPANGYRFAPCQDAIVDILVDARSEFPREELRVNGASYGPIAAGEAILVDHGKVFHEATPKWR